MIRLDRMMDYLPAVYVKSPELQGINKSKASLLDQFQRAADDALDQAFVDTATHGLRKWERELSIVPTDMDYEIRRKNIKHKLSQSIPTNYATLEREVNRYLRNATSIVRLIEGEYAFEVTLPAEDFITDKKVIVDLVEKMKPAHLRALFDLMLLTGTIVLIDDTYSYPVYYPLTGQFWGEKEFTQVETIPLKVIDDTYHYVKEYPTTKKGSTVIESIATTVINNTYSYVKEYRKCGDMEPLNKGVNLFESTNELIFGSYNYKKTYRLTGQFSCEG